MSFLAHLVIPHHTNNQRAKLLHPSSILGIVVFLLVFQFLLTRTSTTLPHILGYASQIPPDEVIRITNQERQARGLRPLTTDPSLSAAAARKAGDMMARDYWAHVSPTGTQPWFFISEAGYQYRYAGENLARDFSDPKSIVNAWLASPSHRENLLSSRYYDIGVAVVDGRLTGRDTTLVVQMFGTKISASPSVGGSSFTAEAAVVPTNAPVQSASEIQSQEIILQQPSLATGKPIASPFTVSQILSFSVLGVLAILLFVDVALVNHRQLFRWTSRSFAHFIFIGILLIAVATVVGGQII